MPAVAPAFAFYASDMMADKRYRVMSLAQRGLLLSLYAECWVNGSVSSIPSELSKIVGYKVDEIEQCLTKDFKSYFIENENEFTSPAMDKYRDSILADRAKRASNGKKGGEKTQQKIREKLNNLDSSSASSAAKAPRIEKNGIELKRQEQSVDSDVTDPFVDEMNAYERTKG
ncbi:MAG: hypothetical protein CTY10_02440 [Methylotenera sp.]|nr:MAG: hypothetical protein CTY10_02440 [Methylotenera sp.]